MVPGGKEAEGRIEDEDEGEGEDQDGMVDETLRLVGVRQSHAVGRTWMIVDSAEGHSFVLVSIAALITDALANVQCRCGKGNSTSTLRLLAHCYRTAKLS